MEISQADNATAALLSEKWVFQNNPFPYFLMTQPDHFLINYS